MVYATFVVALVFVPVLTLTGVQGALVPAARTGLHPGDRSPRCVVALTVTPALTLLLLGGRGHRAARVGPRWPGSRRATPARSSWLRRPARRGGRGGGARLPRGAWRRCRSSAPPSSRSSARGTTWSTCRPCRAPRSTSRFRLGRAGDRGAQARPARPRRWRSGSAGRSCREDTWGTHYTEFEVDLVPLTGEAAETVQDDLRAHPARLSRASTSPSAGSSPSASRRR